jgi:hypothetical protein
LMRDILLTLKALKMEVSVYLSEKDMKEMWISESAPKP